MKKLTKLLSLLMLMALSTVNVWADDLNYLCFTGVEATQVAFNKTGSGWTAPTFQYSTDKENWYDYSFGTKISLAVGDKVYFKEKTTGDAFNGNITFTSTNKVAASGNIMSLLDATCQSTTVPASAFYELFKGCTTLTTAPELPATTLNEYCYDNMFWGCTSLTAAPSLPAGTLAKQCYDHMFYNCTSLTTVPNLEASTLAFGCYYAMFKGCTSLRKAPALSANRLADECYKEMFYGCTSLTSAPTLWAANMAASCYHSMFMNCTSLTTAPALNATNLATYCYDQMFFGCSALTKAPDLMATELPTGCYGSMFQGCTNLNSIKVGFTDWGSDGQTSSWLGFVASTGTFYCANGLPDTRGYNNIPEGWTVSYSLYSALNVGTLTAGVWNTLTLPMLRSNSNKYLIPKNAEICVLKKIENNIANFSSTLPDTGTSGDKLADRYAFIIKPTTDISMIELASVCTTSDFHYTEVNCYGTGYEAHSKASAFSLSAADNTYVLAKADGDTESKFYKVDMDITMPAYRWYVKVLTGGTTGNSAKGSIGISFDGEATGLTLADIEAGAPLKNGKFMKDGKMVIVKNSYKYNAAGQKIK